MFNLGIQELAVIFIIALLFIGPKQLPELAKNLGKMFRDFKRASNEITDSLQREARNVTEFQDDIKSDIKIDYSLLPDTDSVQTTKPSSSIIVENKTDKPDDDRT